MLHSARPVLLHSIQECLPAQTESAGRVGAVAAMPLQRLANQVSHNRDAVGARIKVVVEDGGTVREIHRAVKNVSSFGGSPIRQEIGLGKATAIRRVEVYWPASKSRSVVRGVPLDSMIQMTEGEEDFKILEMRCAPLPGTSCRKEALPR